MKTSSTTTTVRSSWPVSRVPRRRFSVQVRDRDRTTVYLANEVEFVRRDTANDFYFELTMHDVWVWDVYRSDRFVKSVRVLTFKDVNIEELQSKEFELPKELALDE